MCYLLLYSKMIQLYIYLHSFFLKVFFPIMIYCRMLNIVFYTIIVGLCCLSILLIYIRAYMC